MKIKIPGESRTALTHLRDEIISNRRNYEKLNAELAKMKKDLPDYTARLESLEYRTSYEDEKAAAQISIPQVQLALLQRNIPRVEAALAPLPGELLEIMRRIPPAIIAAVEPALKELRKKVSADLKPHFGGGSPADNTVRAAYENVVHGTPQDQFDPLADAVERTPVIQSFKTFFHLEEIEWISQAERAAWDWVNLMDGLLKGEAAWSFEAQPVAETAAA